MLDLTHIAEALPVRFYSNTLPEDVAWPYVLVHLEDYDVRLRQYVRFARHIILDINVHRFRHYGDYPIGELHRYGLVVRKLAEKYRDRICFVLPDLPWDPEGYFRGVQYSNNIRRTYTYHTGFLRYVASICYRYGSQMMLVLQHKPTRPEPKIGKKKVLIDVEGRLYYFRRSCIYVRDLLSLLPRDDVIYGIAVGGLCVVDDVKIIAKFLDIAFREFPKYRIHGLGLILSVVDHLPQPVLARYSYDSTGWTRPVCVKVQQLIRAAKRYSCKTPRERVIYFLAYVARLCEKLRMISLAQELWSMAEKYAKAKNIRELCH